jgi:hypothetical protein
VSAPILLKLISILRVVLRDHFIGIVGAMGTSHLDVQSRREAVRIGFKALWFLLPAGTNELIRGEASESLEALSQNPSQDN